MSDFPYIALEEKGWRMAMGLRPLDMNRWLEIDEHRDVELEEKQRLLASKYDLVVATNPQGLAGSVELLAEVTAFLAARVLTIEATPPDEHPIVAASRMVQEDLCVLVRSDTWRLQAACVCFPSRWNLASKLGATLDEIHRPVPGYDVQLANPTTAFFERLKSERSFWRLNWTLIDNPALHQPTSARQSPHGDLDDWYFRVERQTLRRLVESGAIVFTIRNYVASARSLCDAHDGFAAALLHNLDTAPEEMREYKGWRGVADRLRESLSTT